MFGAEAIKFDHKIAGRIEKASGYQNMDLVYGSKTSEWYNNLENWNLEDPEEPDEPEAQDFRVISSASCATPNSSQPSNYNRKRDRTLRKMARAVGARCRYQDEMRKKWDKWDTDPELKQEMTAISSQYGMRELDYDEFYRRHEDELADLIESKGLWSDLDIRQPMTAAQRSAREQERREREQKMRDQREREEEDERRAKERADRRKARDDRRKPGDERPSGFV